MGDANIPSRRPLSLGPSVLMAPGRRAPFSEQYSSPWSSGSIMEVIKGDLHSKRPGAPIITMITLKSGVISYCGGQKLLSTR